MIITYVFMFPCNHVSDSLSFCLFSKSCLPLFDKRKILKRKKQPNRSQLNWYDSDIVDFLVFIITSEFSNHLTHLSQSFLYNNNDNDNNKITHSIHSLSNSVTSSSVRMGP